MAKALEGQRTRNDLKMQIAELSKLLADERDGALKSHEEKLALINDVARAKRAADEANERREAMECARTARRKRSSRRRRTPCDARRSSRGETRARWSRSASVCARRASRRAKTFENARVAEERLAKELKRRDSEVDASRGGSHPGAMRRPLQRRTRRDALCAVEGRLGGRGDPISNATGALNESHETANAAMAADGRRARLSPRRLRRTR